MAKPLTVKPAEEYYISQEGNDQWSGTLPQPNEDGTDGPWASFQQAQRVLRALKGTGQLTDRVTVYLRAGRHYLEEPLSFGPADSMPVTFRSYPEEQAVIDGGRKIEGWRTECVNGVEAWVTDIPEVAEGKWYFRQLFVNGRRRQRPRLPKQGRYRLTEVPGMPLPSGWGRGGYTQFRLGKGEMKSWKNLTDVEVVAFHFWIDERFPVAAFDEDTEMITTARPSWAPLTEAHGEKLAPVFIENMFEALTEPGEWYLDRSTGKLYYIPLEGEDPETTEVYAPRLLQLVRLWGAPEKNRLVEFIRFEDLAFEHSAWVQPGQGDPEMYRPFNDPSRTVSRHYRVDKASGAQAASDVPGAISLHGARACAFENCRIANLGWYGVQIGDGCRGIRIVGCDIVDVGAGGVKINGAASDEPIKLQTGGNRVTDCEIHECSRVFHCGVGILSMNSFGNVLSHNHIHDVYYSGISCGWVWGYSSSVSRDNMIEKNHIHNIGQGLLSDMGGIYTLGVQPGTVLRGNVIHDVEKLNYGAWCIYPDEGTSHVLIENNICYDTNGEIFHQHYGRENIVRNNIFAFGGDSVLAHGRADLEHNAFTLERNIFVTDGRPIFKGGYRALIQWRNVRSDLNLLWDVSGKPFTFIDREGEMSLKEWQEVGHDRHSIVADPKFADVANNDYAVTDDSPAVTELGFVPIDTSDLGPRPRDQRD